MSTTLKSDLSHQIRAYEKVFKSYQEFSSMLETYFKNACQNAVPQAIVQTRTKTLSSFAEKAIRKADTYPDPINQFGDLCGARIIVHTLEQVRWVNEFIEKNFEIIEKEDVQKRLGNNQFGYLSMHYNVTIKPNIKYGISNKLLKTISGKKAEIQVKTILQHAWSDILHDRTYKGKAELPEDIKRNAAILAALMEEGDEKFERVVERIDNYSLNFSAYMTKEEIKNEIETLSRLLELEPSNGNKISTALKLAKLTSLADQDYKKVEELLQPYENTPCHERPYLMLELGLAHCKLNRTNPESKDYKKGQELFRKVFEECNGNGNNQVIDHQKLKSLKALAQARLAWSYEPFHQRRNLTSEHYYQALKLEPANPYYLSESLGYHHSLQNN
ncbi:MAG: RelA/SpoT domain-containing protein [Bacteroidales bacterium]|nr:RelA/SpoT domain-containing protein [Bacteroidales bacterium]